MKQKTIRLNGELYTLKNNIVYGAKYIGLSDDDMMVPQYEWVKTKYCIGEKCILISFEDHSPNALRSGKTKPRFEIRFQDDGIGGNSNRDIKRYHGWRGTTNDIACYAHGLRKITKIRELKNGNIAVTVGKGILPDEA